MKGNRILHVEKSAFLLCLGTTMKCPIPCEARSIYVEEEVEGWVVLKFPDRASKGVVTTVPPTEVGRARSSLLGLATSRSEALTEPPLEKRTTQARDSEVPEQLAISISRARAAVIRERASLRTSPVPQS